MITREERLRRVGELAAHADALSGHCLEATVCVYTVNLGGVPAALGSAVLLALGPIRFLVTAAHVLDERHHAHLVVPAGEKLAYVSGDVTRVYATAAIRGDDSIDGTRDHVDTAVVRLRPDLADLWPSSAFVTQSELDYLPRVPTRDAFALLGYPLTKQRDSIRGTEITAVAYRMTAEESPLEVYRVEGRTPDHSIMLGFEKRKMWGVDGEKEMSDLQGVSGGGVWRFGPILRDAQAPPRLAGIAVEWYPRRRHPYILATRIGAVLAALVARYPDVREVVAGSPLTMPPPNP